MAIKIRPMTTDDSAVVADLCGQLGYPSTRDQILERFADVERHANGALFVAEDDGHVIGWIHVAMVALLEADLYALIEGLVVDETRRSQGVGAALLESAERWAREDGCRVMRVSSRIQRERAHAFYERSGYVRIKTQHAFEKRLT
jgi:GNAT superfamily N-acetyltransferase